MFYIYYLFYYLYYLLQRKVVAGFLINKNDLVIDIGSGDKPFWRADVFFDKLSLENYQRATAGKTITNFGIFVDGEISKTNFKKKVFDFSYCSHVLEHVEDPESAIREIMRISKKGYIEVPNGLIECAAPFSSHLWFVFQNKDMLIFVRKSRQMHKILLENRNYIKTFFKEPFIRLYWKNTINYQIIDDLKIKDKFNGENAHDTESIATNVVYNFIVDILRKLFYKRKNITKKTLFMTI
jgi:SAM-dependent methyltransferase